VAHAVGATAKTDEHGEKPMEMVMFFMVKNHGCVGKFGENPKIGCS
jgi:hypothetical protein